MTAIAAQLVGGIWQPATPIPSDAFETVASPTGYTVVTPADQYSASPPVTPLQSISNVWSGNKLVPASFFGCHYGKWPGSGTPPLVSHSVVRTHDYTGGSNTWRARWNKIETSAGVFDWTLLDNFVNFHYAAGRQILHTLFGTPVFYSARPSETCSYELGAAAEPSDLTKWDAYCTALATRYAGKITHYEIWNEPNLVGFFTGTQSILSQLTRRASQIIKAIDPAAKIVSSPVTSLQTGGSGLTYFLNMMQASDGASGQMKSWVDVVGCHLYPANYAGLSALPQMITDIRAHMVTLGINTKPLWNTEFSVLSPSFATMSSSQRRAAIQRMLTVSSAHNSGGCDVSIWYGGDNSTLGFVDEDQNTWETHRSLLMQGVTVINQLKDGRTAAVVGGKNFLW